MIVHFFEIAGDNNAHPLLATATKCKWLQIQAGLNNSGTVRYGDSSTSSTVGLQATKGAGLLFRPIAEISEFYDLSQIYAWVATGDVLDVLYVTG
ncbi:MAG TPA: hypothetical protein VFO46_02435 [Candidatus Sulfotelmatobacter sp.]|nr:hypothetical protein [Candidatus Sulfotelmatobacter sp.]